jgi:outer membrane protein assembly factor BamB
VYEGRLYVHNEQGILTCRDARTGKELYRQRLEGKFTASAVAGDGKLYFVNEDGVTFVVKSGPSFELLARNVVPGECLASPAISEGNVFLRVGRQLFCVNKK